MKISLVFLNFFYYHCIFFQWKAAAYSWAAIDLIAVMNESWPLVLIHYLLVLKRNEFLLWKRLTLNLPSLIFISKSKKLAWQCCIQICFLYQMYFSTIWTVGVPGKCTQKVFKTFYHAILSKNWMKVLWILLEIFF